MNRSLMSLCLFGAALATGNALFLQRTTCPSEDKKTLATLSSLRNVSSQKTASFTPQDKPSKAQKAADTASAASRDVTGSLGGEIETPGPMDKTEAKPPKIGDEFADWADVSIAAKMHSAPSVSAPILRYYRVGTRLRVIERQTGWTKVIDPVTSKQGWIYEKYLVSRDGPTQTQADLRQPPEPSAQQRKLVSRRYGSQRPRFRIMFGVYPRW